MKYLNKKFVTRTGAVALTAAAGFTLIELMIVIAIIGILASIALPAYQDYIARSKVTEAVTILEGCKTLVTEYASTQSAWPTPAQAGCTTTTGRYFNNLQITNGAVSVTLVNINTDINNATLTLTPANAAGTAITDPQASIQRWNCRSSTTTGQRFLPTVCKN